MKKELLVIGITLVLLAVSLSGCSDTSKEDELRGLGYSNTVYGFGLNPPSGWTTDESGLMGTIVIFYGPTEDNFTVNVFVTAGQLETGETLSDSVEEVIEFYTNYFTNFSLLSSNARTVNGMAAHEIIYTYLQGVNNLKQKQVMVEKNRKTIILTYSAIVSSYDNYLSVFDQSVSSIVII